MKTMVMLVLAVVVSGWVHAAERPEAFVEIREVIPDASMDIRYFTEHNFVGARVDGYEAPKCYLTRQAAQALARVQADLVALGYGVKIYDCYRPQRAVDHFARWGKDLDDTATRTEFYPTVDKRNLFRDGYIAEKSGHSRGSTVDLTIVALPPAVQPAFILGETEQRACFLPAEQRFPDNGIDMGTGFDCFHALSHAENPQLSPQQRRNRQLLRTLMEKHGFRHYAKEWWHFTLIDEPFRNTYFDFVVQ